MTISLYHDNPHHAFQRAVDCATFPLKAGTAIFLLWLLTQWSIFMAAGIMTLLVGLFYFLAGFVCLWDFLALGWNAKDLTRPRILGFASLGALLLLSNFVVAGLYSTWAFSIYYSYDVRIVNQSERPLKAVQLVASREIITLGTISAGGSKSCSFRDIGEGQLVLEATHGDQIIHHVVDGYTMQIKTHRTVTLLANHLIQVENP